MVKTITTIQIQTKDCVDVDSVAVPSVSTISVEFPFAQKNQISKNYRGDFKCHKN